MYTRYYDGYTQRSGSTAPCDAPCQVTEKLPSGEISVAAQEPETDISTAMASGLPFNLMPDDIVLIAVLFLVASESDDDFILPLILGYLLLSNR